MVVIQEFDLFRFPNDYKWCLAFYKLCAIYHMAHEMSYEYYAYLDADIYVHSSFDQIFEECKDHILLYDTNQGLQVKSYCLFLKQIKDYFPKERMLTRYGGEFFAGNREQTLSFSETCLTIFNDMYTRSIETDYGDEFILALAAEKNKKMVKNAGGYVFRFWTGAFRQVSTNYKYAPVVVFHVPAEKNRGMIVLYNRYIARGMIPKESILFRILHFKHRALKTTIHVMIDNIIRYKEKT